MQALYRTVTSPHGVLAIVLAKDWFTLSGVLSAIYGDYYVVATWEEYPIEGGHKRESDHTVAITRDLRHAEMVYNDLVPKP